MSWICVFKGPFGGLVISHVIGSAYLHELNGLDGLIWHLLAWGDGWNDGWFAFVIRMDNLFCSMANMYPCFNTKYLPLATAAIFNFRMLSVNLK